MEQATLHNSHRQFILYYSTENDEALNFLSLFLLCLVIVEALQPGSPMATNSVVSHSLEIKSSGAECGVQLQIGPN